MQNFCKDKSLFAKFADAGWHGTIPLIQSRVALDNPSKFNSVFSPDPELSHKSIHDWVPIWF